MSGLHQFHERFGQALADIGYTKHTFIRRKGETEPFMIKYTKPAAPETVFENEGTIDVYYATIAEKPPGESVGGDEVEAKINVWTCIGMNAPNTAKRIADQLSMKNIPARATKHKGDSVVAIRWTPDWNNF